ncbi:MAG: aspartate-semialdehyde dehydrogenase [Thermoplasmata archaeon]|nr:aspartate-semialdehyde dehydrogenase [Thermoplasmata archaeon]
MTGALRRPTAILGAAGYIGQHFARKLEGHPMFDEPRLIGSERTDGLRLRDVWLLSEEPSDSLGDDRIGRESPGELARSGVKVVFSALPSGTAGPIERELARRGVAVFSNAADLRGTTGVPLLVPEVNPAHLRGLSARPRGSAPIVNNPNCSATGLALALAPLVPLLRPRAVHVATYQALSGAGSPGVAALAIADNVVPYIAEEEEKLAAETRSLLGDYRQRKVRPLDIPVLAHCARVGTRDGHLEAVTVEATARPDLAEITAAWRSFDPMAGRALPSAPHPPVMVRSEIDRPQPRRDRWSGAPRSARGMAVSVGRIRWAPPYLRFFLLSHNAVRGGAGGSVLNAEFAVDEGWLPA